VKPATTANFARPRTLGSLRNVLSDALYRGSAYLLANTVAASVIGFAFWTLAAHRYSAPEVGVFSSLTSGAGLLAAIAALGLPITMTRHIAGAEDPRTLVVAAVAVIATVGTALCLLTVLLLGPYLPPALHIGQRGSMALLVTGLVVFTAVGGTLDAGLVAMRSSRVVLIKNLVGSAAKLIAMLALTSFRSTGLLLSFGLGLVLATMLSGVALGWRIRGQRAPISSFRVPWRYLSATSGNYLATVIGILPLSLVPIEVLAIRGAAETARFSVAFLIAGFLNFIPSTTGQVLFAEVARGGVPLGRQLRKALRAVYGLLLPSLAVLLAAAPLVLRLFGRAYAEQATGCLRVLALSALAAGGTYLVDSVLIARDRTAAYTFMQVANAGLVLGCVGYLLPRGLTAGAVGWTIAQALTLVIGLIVLATGRAGRHHGAAAPAGKAAWHSQEDPLLPAAMPAVESEVRELLAAWPLMPTMLIAERIGWDQSLQTLSERLRELRLAYSRHYAPDSQAGHAPGENAQCGLWFPPADIPVGYGQIRSAQQLPVLTMITGYSRWLSAVLIPSRRAEDLFLGWWQIIAELGAVPPTLTAPGEDAIGWQADGQTHLTDECRTFCRSLNTRVIVGRPGDPAATGLIERAHAYLEHSFLRGRRFASPADFTAQLRDWLAATNTRPRRPPSWSPAALVAADRDAMLPLPLVPPATGWRLSARVGPVRVGLARVGSTRLVSAPVVRFDANDYCVQPALTGRTVEITADLSQVRVLCDGKLAARHERAWTVGRIVGDPAQGSAAG
jgi:O-antigen/teichoic acid export membrane protein